MIVLIRAFAIQKCECPHVFVVDLPTLKYFHTDKIKSAKVSAFLRSTHQNSNTLAFAQLENTIALTCLHSTAQHFNTLFMFTSKRSEDPNAFLFCWGGVDTVEPRLPALAVRPMACRPVPRRQGWGGVGRGGAGRGTSGRAWRRRRHLLQRRLVIRKLGRWLFLAQGVLGHDL